jgi:hypothetical protein
MKIHRDSCQSIVENSCPSKAFLPSSRTPQHSAAFGSCAHTSQSLVSHINFPGSRRDSRCMAFSGYTGSLHVFALQDAQGVSFTWSHTFSLKVRPTVIWSNCQLISVRPPTNQRAFKTASTSQCQPERRDHVTSERGASASLAPLPGRCQGSYKCLRSVYCSTTRSIESCP